MITKIINKFKVKSLIISGSEIRVPVPSPEFCEFRLGIGTEFSDRCLAVDTTNIPSMPGEGDIELSIQMDKLQIHAGGYSVSIDYSEAVENKMKLSKICQINTDCIHNASVCVSKNAAIPAFTKIRVGAEGEVVGTDGNRLIICQTAPMPELGSTEYLIPANMAWYLPQHSLATISAADKIFEISVDGFAIRHALEEVRFPNYRQVIPNYGENGLGFELNRAEIKTLAQICRLARGKKAPAGLSIEIKKGIHAKITIENPNTEKAFPAIELRFANEQYAHFNPKYLIDMLDPKASSILVTRDRRGWVPWAFQNGTTKTIIMPICRPA